MLVTGQFKKNVNFPAKILQTINRSWPYLEKVYPDSLFLSHLFFLPRFNNELSVALICARDLAGLLQLELIT
mgnify:CR=1 FL=1